MQDREELLQKLAEYESEHRTLDDQIKDALHSGEPINMLQIQQFKKKKLWLKDMIQKIRSSLIDDIIA